MFASDPRHQSILERSRAFVAASEAAAEWPTAIAVALERTAGRNPLFGTVEGDVEKFCHTVDEAIRLAIGEHAARRQATEVNRGGREP